MDSRDFEPFCAMLDDVWAFYPQAKPPTPGQKAMFFRALGELTIAQVRKGFDGHVKDPQRGRFPPLPADLIAQIEGAKADDGRPGPEEAWATALRGRDEAATVVWTDEMSQAWGIAQPVFALGDEVGARMAFRETYARLVELARRERRPAQWWPSIGTDRSLQRDAIVQAVELGRLPRRELLELPAPVKGDEMLALTGPNSGAPPSVRQKLRELADSMRRQPDAPGQDAIDKQRTAELRKDAADAVERYQRGQEAA